MNDNRKKLTDLLTKDQKIDRIVVEHKDRLTRFGFNYLELLSKSRGFEIVVVNPTQDDKEDLLEDLVSIVTSFCARIYGQRRCKRKTEAITKLLREDLNETH